MKNSTEEDNETQEAISTFLVNLLINIKDL